MRAKPGLSLASKPSLSVPDPPNELTQFSSGWFRDSL